MISSSGDGIAFFTTRDALAIQFDLPGEAIRLERSARVSRGDQTDLGSRQPQLLENAARSSRELPVLPSSQVSAVMVKLQPGVEPASVAGAISAWSDVTVYSRDQQADLLLRGTVEKVRRQIGLFRALLTIIAAIIMALILYTLTLDKIHSIALLKLIGAQNLVIIGMIMQQALILGGIGYAIAYAAGRQIFPNFPRRVILTDSDLLQLAGIVLAISVLSSLLGIWKALKVSPNEALS
jgi:putative ABC transport system permease protein